MKRILSLLLAAALAAGLLLGPASAADAAPWVEADGIGTAAQTISLRGLSGSYDSLQLTLTLDKAPTAFTFAPALSGDDAHSAYRVSGSSIILFVTSKNQINQGETVLLGTLAAPAGFRVVSASGLKLLNLDTAHIREESFSQVGVGSAEIPVSIPFTDVPESEWYHEAVSYVYNSTPRLMNGTGDTTFSPGDTTTRGMIVTILWRLEGSPVVNYLMPFTDVDQGVWYAEAVRWAASERIVNGYPEGVFLPEDPITREQMATILWNYAKYKGYDVSGKTDLSAVFTDAQQVSGYAWDAIAWANHEKLINGMTDTILQPQGSAIRAQVAAILMRFRENIAK